MMQVISEIASTKIPKLFFVYYNKKYHAKLNQQIPILVSAGHQFKNNRLRAWEIPAFVSELMLDSGGFQLVGKFGDYPFTNEQYLEYIQEVKPTYAVTLDYPCDGADHPSPHVKLTNKQRIERTVDNTAWLLDHEGRVTSKIIPVIQGYKVSEYLECIDLLKERGCIRDIMGVGSVCIRKRKHDVIEVLRAIKKELPNTRLHVFGLNLNIVKDPRVRCRIDSFDTLAWMYNSKFGRVYAFTGKRLVELDTRKKLSDSERQSMSLKAYLEYYDYLCKIWREQTLDYYF
jgi:queuine/archaeosine tRNA-ribosyltransferase